MVLQEPLGQIVVDDHRNHRSQESNPEKKVNALPIARSAKKVDDQTDSGKHSDEVKNVHFDLRAGITYTTVHVF